MTLDLAIGETSAIESEDKGKIQDIAQKVRDLNGRLQDIRREQVFQRVRMIIFLELLYSVVLPKKKKKKTQGQATTVHQANKLTS